MREIKFRAWDKDDKVMLSWEYHLYSYAKNQGMSSMEWFDHEILMQYTGLKDIEKKEVYEGDIVYETFMGEDDVYKGEVVWFDSGWFIKTKEHGTLALTDCSESIEVIGNIYENPELIGGK